MDKAGETEVRQKRYKPSWKPSCDICVVPNLVMVENFWMSWPSGRFLLVCEGRNLASEFFLAVEFNFVWSCKAEIQKCYLLQQLWKGQVNRETDWFFKNSDNFGLLPFCWEFFNKWELRVLLSLHVIVAYRKIKIVQRAQWEMIENGAVQWILDLW